MPAVSFPSAMRSDKTIAAAWTVLALFGAAQLFAVVFHYVGRSRANTLISPSITASATKSSGVAQSPGSTETRIASPPALNSLTQPPLSNGSVSGAGRLIREAKALRDRGDTATALTKLEEATRQDPKNGNVLAEMAMIYESMQLLDRSNETWRRLQQTESPDTPLYELADIKLKSGVPARTSSGPGIAGVSPLDAGTARADVDGIPDGSTFGVTEATPAKTTDPDADTHVVLKVGVKARPNTPVDYTKVKIQVFFYDVVDNDRIVLTDADVSYEWLTPDHNWSSTNPEVLAVTYLRAKKDSISSDAALSAAAAAVTPPAAGKRGRSRTQPPPADSPADAVGQRKYLGYIVRVYYKDQLQAVRADPTKLLNLFPPPFTAPSPAQ